MTEGTHVGASPSETTKINPLIIALPILLAVCTLLYMFPLSIVELDPGRSSSFENHTTNLKNLKHASDIIRPGEWNHISCVYKEGDTRCYINGEAVSEDQYIKELRAKSFNFTTPKEQYTIAYWVNLGTIDDIQVFNITLSDKQIQHLYETK